MAFGQGLDVFVGVKFILFYLFYPINLANYSGFVFALWVGLNAQVFIVFPTPTVKPDGLILPQVREMCAENEKMSNLQYWRFDYDSVIK